MKAQDLIIQETMEYTLYEMAAESYALECISKEKM